MNFTECSRLSYICAFFGTHNGAKEAYEELKPFVRAAGLEVEAVVVAERKEDGKVVAHERDAIHLKQLPAQHKDKSKQLAHYIASILMSQEESQKDTDLSQLARELTGRTSALLAAVSHEMVTAILDHLVICGAIVNTGPLAASMSVSREADFWTLVD